MTAGWSVEVTWLPDAAVVSLDGEVDFANAESLKSALHAALTARHGSGVVCCDLSRVSFMDSSGLAALIAAHRRAARHDVRLCLTGAHGAMRRILQLTELDQIMGLYETVELARAACKGNSADVED